LSNREIQVAELIAELAQNIRGPRKSAIDNQHCPHEYQVETDRDNEQNGVHGKLADLDSTFYPEGNKDRSLHTARI
jgi:hypothetical protein